jgi:hypothetical protein
MSVHLATRHDRTNNALSFDDSLSLDLFSQGTGRASWTGFPMLGQSSNCSLDLAVFWNNVSDFRRILI